MNSSIICPICGFESENLTSHIATHNMTTKEFKKQFGIKYVQSDRLRAIHASNININNPTKGKWHSVSSIEKMSKNRTGVGIGYAGKYVRTPEIREKISKGVIEAHFRGDYDNVQPGVGSFEYSQKMRTTIFARSTWEASLIDIFDKHPRITSFVAEPFSIPYMFEGSQHRYIPDFLVKYDDAIHSIWEVKGDHFMKDLKTQAKISILGEFCQDNGYNMFIVDSKILKRLQIYVKGL